MGQNKRDKYRFGNFDSYYQDRNNEQWTDKRVDSFHKDWFENKDIVDIGSNDGTLTIIIACNFNPKSITGIEYDHNLVNRSVDNCVFIENCRLQMTEYRAEIEALEELRSFPISFKQYLRLPNHVSSLEYLVSIKNKILTGGRFPSNISFKVGNAVEATWKADTVLCLSTVKWIHLNWGDEGVLILFNKIYANLNDGGLFIFEPQDWKSYKKSKVKSSILSKNFDEIKFRPEDFHDYLLGIGFKLLLSISPTETKENFNRKINVYQK